MTSFNYSTLALRRQIEGYHNIITKKTHFRDYIKLALCYDNSFALFYCQQHKNTTPILSSSARSNLNENHEWKKTKSKKLEGWL